MTSKVFFLNVFMIACCLVFLNVHIISAQNISDFDQRLLVKYSQEQLTQMSESDIEYKVWKLNNSFEILTFDQHKTEGLPKLQYYNSSSKTVGEYVQNINPENVNIYKYFYERNYDRPQVYKIGNTGDVIYFYSQKKLAEKFNLLKDGK